MKEKLWKLTATEAHQLLKQKEISAIELLEDSIARVTEVDSDLNALPEKCFERARTVASRIGNTKPENVNNLLGLPIAVKDYNDLAGVKTTYGSPLFTNNVPTASDRTISALEKNGANAIAKSNECFRREIASIETILGHS